MKKQLLKKQLDDGVYLELQKWTSKASKESWSRYQLILHFNQDASLSWPPDCEPYPKDIFEKVYHSINTQQDFINLLLGKNPQKYVM